MNNKEPNDLTRIRGKYAVKYGHEIDDWSALFLSETEEHFQKLESRVDKSIAAIDRAALDLRGRKRHLQFQDQRQALFYGLGVSGPYSIAGIVVAVLFYLLVTHAHQFRRRQELLKQFENAPAYLNLMQTGKIVEQDGMEYLQLSPMPKKGALKIGEHYIYDPKANGVLVPLRGR